VKAAVLLDYISERVNFNVTHFEEVETRMFDSFQGGLFLFLEHCSEPLDTSLYKMQNFLTVTKLWPMLFDGCHLNRNVLQDIKFAQFSDIDYQYITIDSEHNKFSKLMRTHLIGTAVK
jgi:hypothetical protein